MGKKFYAVKKGVKPGIYLTWNECKDNVSGYSGAEYKSFQNEKDAKLYLGMLEDNLTEDMCIKSETEVIAYVDGSYDDIKKQYACGVVIFHNGEEKHFSEKFSNSGMAVMRNVAGEIEGAKRAIKYCLDNSVSSLSIYYDYEGIEKWCDGTWTAKKEGTKAYKRYYDDAVKFIDISFVKVKGHSGDKYNDLADELAKRALGISSSCVPLETNCKGIVANNIKFDDFNSILELLGEDFNNFSIDQKEIPYGTSYKISCEVNSEIQNIRVSFYNGKNKLFIEGDKNKELFNRLSMYIVELLEIDDIPEFLNTVHNLEVDTDVVVDEFVRYFPNSHNDLPEELSKYLHQAVYNLHIMGNMYVCNFLVEPAIRPLEGVLKIALQDNNIPIRKDNLDYDSFFVFEECGDRYKLRDSYIESNHTKEFLDYISEGITYFRKNRNTLFHWDNPKHALDTTRILNTVEEAHTIIKDSIKLIDKYYEICKN